MQLMGSRQFIAEHPQGSEMWRMPAWLALAERWPIAWVVIDQCAVGLRGPRTGSFINKPTEIWASDEALVARLRGRRCPGDHVHADLAANVAGRPAEKAKDAARWPMPLCRLLAAGCEEVIRRRLQEAKKKKRPPKKKVRFAGQVSLVVSDHTPTPAAPTHENAVPSAKPPLAGERGGPP